MHANDNHDTNKYDGDIVVIEHLNQFQRCCQCALIHTMTGMLKGFFKSNPFHQQNLKVFAKGRAEFYSLIVPINSPLKPILQTASNSLTEAGARDYLLKQWEGTGIPQAGAVEVMVLTAGQVILVFFIVLGTFSMAWVAFFCELCHKTIKDFKKARAERFDSRGTTGRKTGKKHGNQLPKDLLKYPNDKSCINPIIIVYIICLYNHKQ